MISTLRRHKARDTTINWLAVFLWAALIFYFSTDQFSSSHTAQLLDPVVHRLFPGISLDRIESIHFLVRKLGHWSEYAVFSILLSRALRDDREGGFRLRYAAWTVALVFIYAASDEFHQTYVPGRTASIRDVLIDLFGGICGTFWMLTHGKKKQEP